MSDTHTGIKSLIASYKRSLGSARPRWVECVTCAHQHIMGGGVPAQDANTFGVTVQLDDGIRERRRQPRVRDLPNLSHHTDDIYDTEFHITKRCE